MAISLECVGKGDPIKINLDLNINYYESISISYNVLKLISSDSSGVKFIFLLTYLLTSAATREDIWS